MAVRMVLLASLVIGACQTPGNLTKVRGQDEPAGGAPAVARFVCGMNDHSARPYFTFSIRLAGGRASVSSTRSAFFGSEEFAPEVPLRGLQNIVARWSRGHTRLYFEGDGDGEAGYGTIDLVGGNWVGFIFFPEEGRHDGLPMDQEIPLSCRAEGGGSTGPVDRFVCGMNDHSARPYFTFSIRLAGGRASVSSTRSAFFGSEEFALEVPLRGLQDIVARWSRGNTRLYFEGDGDGDAGYGTIDLVGGNWVGFIFFPEEGRRDGLPMDQEIPLSCRAEGGGSTGSVDRFVCGMNDHSARPYFTFSIRLAGGRASVSSRRSAFFGSEEFAPEVPLRGLQDSIARWSRRNTRLSFEGDGDGEAGYGTIDLVGGNWVGFIFFPEEGRHDGLPMDQEIPLSCRVES